MSKTSRAAGRRFPILCAVCAFALAVFSLVGCSASQNSQVNEQQTANRQYMTQVNQKMDALTTRLSSFSDAVSRDDLVTMRTQADNAFKVIDEISSLDVPSDMKDIQEGYLDGCTDLKDALTAYIELYSDIEAATDAQPFDYSTYADRLQAIQDQYNAGIEKLKAGDESATGKE